MLTGATEDLRAIVGVGAAAAANVPIPKRDSNVPECWGLADFFLVNAKPGYGGNKLEFEMTRDKLALGGAERCGKLIKSNVKGGNNCMLAAENKKLSNEKTSNNKSNVVQI